MTNLKNDKGEKPHRGPKAAKLPGRLFMPFFSLAILLLGLCVFSPLLKPGAILSAQDGNIGAMAAYKEALPNGILGWWKNDHMAGLGRAQQLNGTTLLLALLPIRAFNNWVYALVLFISSVGLALYLRRLGRSWSASFVAAVTTCWVGSTLTLCYAGHLRKFGVVMDAALFLWLIETASQKRSLKWAVLAGIPFGSMFAEQPDVAFLFAVILGPYALFTVIRHSGLNWRPITRVLIPCMLIAFGVAFRPLWTGYKLDVTSVTSGESQAAEEKWDFITQWSWPPEECIDFIAPAYFGIRSGEPEGPYWGRMGRSAQWESTRQGFPNFKLESEYIGLFPLLLCLTALIIAALRRPELKERPVVVFWGIAGLAVLLLAFGKYTPVYKLFYQLPIVSHVRAPVKFLQIFQFAVGILAAFGWDWLVTRPRSDERGKLERNLVIAAWSIFGLLLVGLLATTRTQSGALSHFGFSQEMLTRVQVLRLQAMLHASGIALLTAALVTTLIRFPRWAITARGRLFTVALPLVLLAADAVIVSRPYIKTLDPSMIAANPVTNEIVRNQGHQRVALLSQAGPYNAWLTYLFPHEGIHSFNVTQFPRMPADYKTFLGAMGRNSFGIWYLSAVKDILAPIQAWQQINRASAQFPTMTPVMGFDFMPRGASGFTATPTPAGQQPSQILLRLANPMPRYALFSDWELGSREEALRRTAHITGRGPYIPIVSGAAPTPSMADASGTVEVVQATASRVELSVSNQNSIILRIADRFDPDRKIYIDGKLAEAFPCDYLFTAVPISPGRHVVELRYRVTLGPLALQLLAYALGALSLCLIGITHMRREHAIDKE